MGFVPMSTNSRYREHRAQMVALRHSHWPARLVNRYRHIMRAEDAPDRKHRGSAAVIDHRTGPIKNDGTKRTEKPSATRRLLFRVTGFVNHFEVKDVVETA